MRRCAFSSLTRSVILKSFYARAITEIVWWCVLSSLTHKKARSCLIAYLYSTSSSTFHYLRLYSTSLLDSYAVRIPAKSLSFLVYAFAFQGKRSRVVQNGGTALLTDLSAGFPQPTSSAQPSRAQTPTLGEAACSLEERLKAQTPS